jgi:hypothetical protein
MGEAAARAEQHGVQRNEAFLLVRHTSSLRVQSTCARMQKSGILQSYRRKKFIGMQTSPHVGHASGQAGRPSHLALLGILLKRVCGATAAPRRKGYRP